MNSSWKTTIRAIASAAGPAPGSALGSRAGAAIQAGDAHGREKALARAIRHTPVQILAWGEGDGSYLAWFLFLFFGTLVYAAWARDACYYQLRKRGVSPEASRKIAAAHGQELFPREAVWQAVITAAEAPRTWGLVALYFTSFGGFLIPLELGATVDALGSAGYAGGFFAYVVLALMAIGISWHFKRLDAKSRS